MNTNLASTRRLFQRIEIFTLALIFSAIIFPLETHAAGTTYYWDINSTVSGSGGTTPSGNWDGTAKNWNSDSTGAALGSFVTSPGTGNPGTFSAGSDATGSYTITLSGTQNAQSLTAKNGSVILHGGTLALDDNISSGTAYLVASAGANLTLDSSCTLSVNNSSTAAAGNFVNLGAAANQTVTINGPVTATVNNSANKIFIRSTTAGNNIINYNLGTDAAFKTGLQAGGFDGAGSLTVAGTLTIKGSQSLGTTPLNCSGRIGTVNLGDVVNTGNAVVLGAVTLAGSANNLAGATYNFNSAVTCSSITLSSGGALNVGGSVVTSGTTAVGRTSDTYHGATMKILSGGVATLGTINVLDGSTFTDAGTLTGTTLTLGEATGNTAGNLVLGDSTATGAATFTGLTTPGSGAKTIVGGNASASTLTLNLAGTTTLGTTLTLGGGSGNQNNLTLDKTGAGTLVMGNGANTYSGGTIFENGGIQLGANNALGSGPLTIGTANTSLSVNSGFLKVQLSGYDQTVTGLANGNVGTIIIEANAGPVGGNNMTAPVAGSYSLITAASGLDGGTWQFSDTGNQTKTVTVNGSAYTLTLNHGVTSVYVAVTAKTASQLVFTTQPSTSTVAGVAFAQQPVVKIEDQYGNVVTSGSDATKSVALTLTTGAGTLGGTTSMNAVAGVADFTGKGLNINLVGADKVLTATATVAAGTMTTTTSPAFGITPGAASQLVMNPTTISSAAVGTSISGSFTTITAEDTFGNVCSSGANDFNGTVTFAGTAGAAGTSVAFTHGVLSTFPSLTPTVAGSGLTITATSGAVVGTTTITTVGPEAVTDTYSRSPGAGIKIHASDLVANDIVASGYTATFVSCASPTHNSVTLGTSGSGNSTVIVYPSDAGNTADYFTYTISDGHGGTATGTVNITINNNVTGQATIDLAGQVATISFFG